MCGRQMVVSVGGKSVTVTVADTCPSCAPGSVDLSPAAFHKLAPSEEGSLFPVTWSFD